MNAKVARANLMKVRTAKRMIDMIALHKTLSIDLNLSSADIKVLYLTLRHLYSGTQRPLTSKNDIFKEIVKLLKEDTQVKGIISINRNNIYDSANNLLKGGFLTTCPISEYKNRCEGFGISAHAADKRRKETWKNHSIIPAAQIVQGVGVSPRIIYPAEIYSLLGGLLVYPSTNPLLAEIPPEGADICHIRHETIELLRELGFQPESLAALIMWSGAKEGKNRGGD